MMMTASPDLYYSAVPHCSGGPADGIVDGADCGGYHVMPAVEQDSVPNGTARLSQLPTTTPPSPPPPPPPPLGRCQANARESVNSAFGTLRDMIPTEPLDRKLSKIETLRLAQSYIQHLAAVLCTGQLISPCSMGLRQQQLHQQQQQQLQPQSTRAPPKTKRRSTICTFCVAGRAGPAAAGRTLHRQ